MHRTYNSSMIHYAHKVTNVHTRTHAHTVTNIRTCTNAHTVTNIHTRTHAHTRTRIQITESNQTVKLNTFFRMPARTIAQNSFFSYTQKYYTQIERTSDNQLTNDNVYIII